MDQYKVVGRIGEGAHGLVLRGQRLDNGQEVALKRVLLKKLEDGIPTTVIREIKALQEIDCEYVRTETIYCSMLLCFLTLGSRWNFSPLFIDNSIISHPNCPLYIVWRQTLVTCLNSH